MKKIEIIGAQVDLGANRRGVNMGPSAIRFAGLSERMEAMGLDIRDRGDLIPMQGGKTRDNMRWYEAIVDVDKRLFAEVLDSLSEGALPVVLGGDHSIAAGSVPAASRHYGRIGLIWIDAHADFNDENSTLTGNVHGMPLSAICGSGPDWLVDYGEDLRYVDPAKVVLVGGRDFDPPERVRLKEAGVNVFNIRDVDTLGMAEVMRRAIDIAGSGTEGIYVSFDMDSIAPQDAPGVVTPVIGGLTSREVFLACEMLAQTGRVIGIDMVEVNPILDERNKTGELACSLILALLGEMKY
ncbi:MAG: arginase [Firmicutes bacterium]|nr:arginase [Bacillota bacterium]MBQ4372198.1 arginase [Bacillota bacterium]